MFKLSDQLLSDKLDIIEKVIKSVSELTAYNGMFWIKQFIDICYIYV